MCGICGVLRFDAGRVDPQFVERMCDTLVHRGPDAQGIWTDGPVGLGQRRLAIIDLRDVGVAPLANEDRTVWVTFNGEIYNFRELRAELAERGHVFTTATDTEVIAHLYEEYGTDCLQRMHGMFAFALWDAKRQRLFAARDRLGKKPFCYQRTATGFRFASEIRAILAVDDAAAQPNFAAIDAYLTHQYVPSPQTAFRGIEKLPAGHFLTCDRSGTLEVSSYWRPPSPPKLTESRTEIERRLRDTLRGAVRKRLVSDVPLGAFLSGGVDSSAVVALMAEESGQRVKTFSIGFDEASHNELPYARLIAERYGTDHHEFVVKPEAADVLPRLVEQYNEPFADSSALPTYYLSKLTRDHVTVALSGDGGDESFSGYASYEQVARWQHADVIPRPVRRALGGGVNRVLDLMPAQRHAARVSRAARMFAEDLPGRYALQMTLVKPQEKAATYTPQFESLIGESSNGTNGLPWGPEMDAIDWMSRHDQSHYLPDCLMVKVDIASMAHSLEVRCPLLDHEVVELAAAIPSAMKRDATGGKLILKSAVRDLIPEPILTRHKTGFGIPIARWFRGELQPLLRETLLDAVARKRNLFQPAAIRRMVDDHVEGRRDWSNRLWAFVALELWFRRFID
jgi:asparagine synthase (glutamine-hydrolysing)